MNTAGLAVSKMLLSGPPAIRAHANASGGMVLPAADIAHARDAEGNYLSYSLLSAALAGMFPYRHGIDTGGSWDCWGRGRPMWSRAEQDGSLLGGVSGGKDPG